MSFTEKNGECDYTLVVEGGISLSVTVRASDEESAWEKAMDSSVRPLCSQCSNYQGDEWSTGELDIGDIESCQLIEVFVDGIPSYHSLQKLSKRQGPSKLERTTRERDEARAFAEECAAALGIDPPWSASHDVERLAEVGAIVGCTVGLSIKGSRFNPSQSVDTPIGRLVVRKADESMTRWVVELDGKELHCSAVPEWAYNYAAGLELGASTAHESAQEEVATVQENYREASLRAAMACESPCGECAGCLLAHETFGNSGDEEDE